ncbi:hypothetical protein SUDANB105_07245 [Streptomyces sp. enrichment culture]|uniref:hypothetical protein n=1 Tax=Streptomyces sp. enrichment culture TaxID=1795815 RepID=UPI003F568799
MTGSQRTPGGAERRREIRRREARVRAARRSRLEAERRRRTGVSSVELGRRARLRRRRAGAVGALLVGIALLATGAFRMVEVTRATDTAREFHAAEPCDGAADTDCLRTVAATVRDTRSADGRHVLRLGGPRPVPAEVTLEDPEPLLTELRPGFRVDVTLWRGEATGIARQGVRQDTTGAPRELSEYATALALLAAGLYGIGTGVVVLRRGARELPGGFGSWSAVALTSVVATIPAVGYGHLLGGPVAAAGVWLLFLLVTGLALHWLEMR